MKLSDITSSYRNHAMHCSAYIALSGYTIQSALSARNNQSSWGVVALWSLPSVIAVWALKSEVSYMIQRAKLPPGDSGYPILGHFNTLMVDGTEFLTAGRERYGPIWTCNLLMTPTVFLTQSEDVKWLSTQERQGHVGAYVLEQASRLVGKESIMVKSGRDHRVLRKVFEPAFTPTAVRDYAETMDATTQAALKQWAMTGDFVNSKEWSLLTLRIFFLCTFGEVKEAMLEDLCDLFQGWMKGFEAKIPVVYPGGGLYKGHQYKARLGKLLLSMVNDFKIQHPPGSDMANGSTLGRLCYSVDEDGNKPSDTVLVDNLAFFLFAGFDTTKATLGAVTYYLSQHSDVRKLVVEEVKSFREPLDYDELKNATLLNAVLSETWRLNAPLNSHATISFKKLHYKGFTLPKGTIICSDTQGYNVDNNIFRSASQFCVARWLPKNHPLYDASLHKPSIDPNLMSPDFRTFNTGPHMCLGSHFAKLEVRIVVTRLLQRYDFEIRNQTVKRYPLLQMRNEIKLTER